VQNGRRVDGFSDFIGAATDKLVLTADAEAKAKKIRMDQELLKTNLNGLERKILVLVNEHKNLKEELKSLKKENQDLKGAIRARDEQLAGFHNQAKITKIVDSLNPEDGSVSELKKKVDEYIREIDKCIAHLSR
jgi:chromosome segregation ATPase